MYTIARNELCLTKHPSIVGTLPSAINVCTSARKHLTNGYLHRFGDAVATALGGDIVELHAGSGLASYSVTYSTSKHCRIKFYTLIQERMHYLAVGEEYALYCVGKNYPETFVADFKALLVLTDKKCVVTLAITPVDKLQVLCSCNYRTTRKRGFTRIMPKKEAQAEADDILAHSLANSLNRQLQTVASLPLIINFEDIIYYLDLSAIITVTTKTLPEYRYPPYSIKLAQASNLRARLKYVIIMKTSAGNDAQVAVTAIETQSSDSYSIIKQDGKELTNNHIGNTAQGSFTLPIGCFDVGLHLYTPYGFSGDIGDNKYTDLAKFTTFTISYVQI